MPELAKRYAEIEGIASSSTNQNLGDGSQICLDLEDKSRTYYFIKASGDCISGCIDKHVTKVRVTAAKQLQTSITDNRQQVKAVIDLNCL
ncbi:hypothetical protein LNL84_02310 [Vibrio sp. ZSDZ34]|uniref:Uncharacterized protein n=1 Tax=Vibrio gelatinilyticus TaxID=2893468 RepID=A0A9X1WER7_9VIBR|nr:hypothetical protein [Vibrio gelatinilyticus]MCJ2375659.1 hypothetical protein [Vibrio gelatinilyticus]